MYAAGGSMGARAALQCYALGRPLRAIQGFVAVVGSQSGNFKFVAGIMTVTIGH
jgi:hypothetical protein